MKEPRNTTFVLWIRISIQINIVKKCNTENQSLVAINTSYCQPVDILNENDDGSDNSGTCDSDQ